HIINETLMNKKADITYVDSEIEKLKKLLNNKLDEQDEFLNQFINDTNKTIDDFKKEISDQLIEGLETLQTELQKFKNDTKKDLDNIKKHVPENHIYSDKYSTLQEAVYAAENGVLHLKKQVYNITTPIKIRSNTTIRCYGSTFKRGANINNMFINDSNGSKGGYKANENIEIEGGIFDASGGSYVDNCSILVFGHSKNIRIINNQFKNLRNWHMIEINACQNVLIENNLFRDYGTSDKGTEMLQIDLAKSTTEFPWFGPYDNTTCDNILIRQNKFEDGVRGVGTHSGVDNKEHTRISILDNEFKNMRGEAVNGLDWAFTKIHRNHVSNAFKGIVLSAKYRAVNNHSIIDNYLSGKSSDQNSRGIQIVGIKDGVGVQNGTISGNKVKYFGGHAVGIDFSGLWTVDGNIIHEIGRIGIIIWGSSRGTITNNVIFSNNRINGSEYDINVREHASNFTISGNNITTSRIFPGVKEIFLIGNIIQNSLNFHETDNYNINNVV